MVRVRLRYEKRGPIRFVSHRDMMRIFRRAFASADIPVCFSQGFNPHPRLSFGPSLRTGWEGFDEYMDVLLEAPSDNLAVGCNRRLPAGFRILEVAAIGAGVPKLAADVTAARYEVCLDGADAFETGSGAHKPLLGRLPQEQRLNGSTWKARVLDELAAAIGERFSGERPSEDGIVEGQNSVPVILEVRCERPDAAGEDTLVKMEYVSTMHGGRSLFPEDILTPLLGDPAGYLTPIRVARKSLYVERGGRHVSPLSRAALET